MYAVELDNIVKKFGNVAAVDNVSLKIRENEFFSLLGPSGCGKTTTLRIIAGLEEPDSGVVKLHGQDVTDVPTHKRNIGMVFQHLALFPHMNVFENVAFGLKMRKVPKNEIKNRVKMILEVVDLSGMEARRINQLSGGQQQRVALARALVTEPSVLLLDEPLGALDLKIRQHMMVELKNIQRRVGTTFIYVTHDQTEAMTMSDRIAIMKDGRLQQVGTPTEIYFKPMSAFVASFIGEAINLIRGRIKDGILTTQDLDQPILVNHGENSSEAYLAVRPEIINIDSELEGLDNIFDGIVRDVIFKGSYIEYRVEVGPRIFVVHQHSRSLMQRNFTVGERVKIGWRRSEGAIIPSSSI